MTIHASPYEQRLQNAIDRFTESHQWQPITSDLWRCSCGTEREYGGRAGHDAYVLREFLRTLSALPDPSDFAMAQYQRLSKSDIGSAAYRDGYYCGARDTLLGIHEFRASEGR